MSMSGSRVGVTLRSKILAVSSMTPSDSPRTVEAAPRQSHPPLSDKTYSPQ